MSGEAAAAVPGNGLREGARKALADSRRDGRDRELGRKRFGVAAQPYRQQESLKDVLKEMSSSRGGASDWKPLLIRLRTALASGEDDPEEFFGGNPSTVDRNLHDLIKDASSGSGSHVQLVAVQVLANLSPLSEKHGLRVARSAGPYLITLLSSASPALREASAVALGNLALAGFKVVKVLLNQGVLERLSMNLPLSPEVFRLSSLPPGPSGSRSPAPAAAADVAEKSPEVVAASLYALYHLLHTLDPLRSAARHPSLLFTDIIGPGTGVLEDLALRCIGLLLENPRGPVEQFWVLFVLSCRPEIHRFMVGDDPPVIQSVLDACTYEIFQKSDPRPLVKVVTPIVRLLANLCAGPLAENACLLTLRHPDLLAILMALLATNYTHLCKETMWLFANIINSDSVVVQEEIVELDLMDKLEYHTVQVIHRLDPYSVR